MPSHFKEDPHQAKPWTSRFKPVREEELTLSKEPEHPRNEKTIATYKKLVYTEGAPKTAENGKDYDTPPDFSEVKYNWTGRIQSTGQLFDTNMRPGHVAHRFKMGEYGYILRAVIDGIRTMKKGERAVIQVPPEMAYGDRHYEYNYRNDLVLIPPNSVLEYEIELLDFYFHEEVDANGKIWKEKITASKEGGPIQPEEYDIVKVEIRTGHDLLTERWIAPIQLTLGTDPSTDSRIEKAIMSMRKGEKSKYWILARPGQESLADKTGRIEYQITLFDMVMGPLRLSNAPLKTFQGKVKHALELKEIGNKFFRANQVKRALRKYKGALQVWDPKNNVPKEKGQDPFTPEELIKVNESKLAILLNMAICQYKVEEYSEAVKSCTQAIKIKRDHLKAVFKRAQAYYMLDDVEEAEKDFLDCEKILRGETLDPLPPDPEEEKEKEEKEKELLREREREHQMNQGKTESEAADQISRVEEVKEEDEHVTKIEEVTEEDEKPKNKIEVVEEKKVVEEPKKVEEIKKPVEEIKPAAGSSSSSSSSSSSTASASAASGAADSKPVQSSHSGNITFDAITKELELVRARKKILKAKERKKYGGFLHQKKIDFIDQEEIEREKANKDWLDPEEAKKVLEARQQMEREEQERVRPLGAAAMQAYQAQKRQAENDY